MGLTLEVRANGDRAPALEHAWQALSVQLGVGYQADSARVTLGVPGGIVDLPPRARLQFHVRRPGAAAAEAVGNLFYSSGVRGSSQHGSVVITAAAIDPDNALTRPRTEHWAGGPLSALAEAVAERAGLTAVIDPALGRRILAPRPQIGASDQAFLGGLVDRLGGRLLIQEDRLIVADAAAPQTASGASLSPVTVDLTAGAWIEWSRKDTHVTARAEAVFAGMDGVTVGQIGAGAGDAVDRLPGTFDSAAQAAAAAARTVQDALADQDSLDVTTGLRLDAMPMAQLVVRGGLPSGFHAGLSIEAVRHEIGRRAATTTITARPMRTIAIDPLPEEPAGVAPSDNPAGASRAPVRLDVVRRLAAAHPAALAAVISNREFLDLVVETLRREDAPEHRLRWGYNCKRGDCSHISHDAIAYYLGDGDPHGSTDVAIIDVIARSTGPDPRPAWNDVSAATRRAGTTGRFIFPRP